MKKALTLLAVLTMGCTAAKAPPPAPAPAASQFKNLQVFSRDIPRDDLIAAMKGFTRGLGVRCNHCHVVTATEPKETFDFPSDAKETKRAARVMIQMVSQINGTWLPRVEEAEHAGEEKEAEKEEEHAEDEDGDETRVSCWTCHRGLPEPDKPAPPSQDP